MSSSSSAPIPPMTARCKEAFNRFWRRESSKASRPSRIYEGDVYRHEAWRAWQIAWTAAIDAANSLNAPFLLRPSTESGQPASDRGSSAATEGQATPGPSTKGYPSEARSNLAHGSALIRPDGEDFQKYTPWGGVRPSDAEYAKRACRCDDSAMACGYCMFVQSGARVRLRAEA